MDLKILIVDDDIETLEFLKDYLSLSNHKILTALNGKEALEQIKKERPHLVVTDIKMPVMDGTELIKNIRMLYPEMVVVILSAVSDVDIILEALKKGARDYILKPDFKGFYNIIEKVIRHIKATEYMKEAISLMEEHLEFNIPSDVRYISGVIKKITNTLEEYGLHNIVTDVSTALDETLTNALFYGNLEFTKEEIDSCRSNELREAIANRLKSNKYKNRKIKVVADITPKLLKFKVADEGRGFDWRLFQKIKELSDFFIDKGHGLFMVNLYMTSVEFNEKGNEITMTLDIAKKENEEKLLLAS